MAHILVWVPTHTMWSLDQVVTASIVPITWRPPPRYLHYDKLYMGIYEWLRAPPTLSRKNAALEYLTSLRRNILLITTPSEIRDLQRHRIEWTEAWLTCLQSGDDMSEADTDDERERHEIHFLGAY